nr:MAG TPA: hypothetical protein [Caudoviricetes sp.]
MLTTRNNRHIVIVNKGATRNPDTLKGKGNGLSLET